MRAVGAVGREAHRSFPAVILNTNALARFLWMKYSPVCGSSPGGAPFHSSHSSTARTLFSGFSYSRAFMNSLPFSFGVRTSQLSQGRA